MKAGLAIALGVSLLVNVAFAANWLITAIDHGHWRADVGSSFRYLAAERAQLQTMRAHFCPHDPTPDRAALLAWEASTRPGDRLGEPFDKDGLLHLRDLEVRIDANGRLAGVCLYQTWQVLDEPNPADLNRASEACPPEPLC